MAQAGRAVIDQQERTKAGASGGGPAERPILFSMNKSADATGGLCIGQRCADTLGAWGPSATNKLRRIYTGALLAHYFHAL